MTEEAQCGIMIMTSGQPLIIAIGWAGDRATLPSRVTAMIPAVRRKVGMIPRCARTGEPFHASLGFPCSDARFDALICDILDIVAKILLGHGRRSRVARSIVGCAGNRAFVASRQQGLMR